eukprot:scaffold1492_cov257-Pinguiococcus_pyrenoidosus.AAC.10
MVNVLLDQGAEPEEASLAILKGSVKASIDKRLEIEEQQRRAAMEAAARRGRKTPSAVLPGDPRGQWLPYIDKVSKKTFFYNKVWQGLEVELHHLDTAEEAKLRWCTIQITRRSQWAEPADYAVNKTYVTKEATFGLGFYH